MEVFFLRHGVRIDHERKQHPDAQPLHSDYPPWDPSLAQSATSQLEGAASQIVALTQSFPEVDEPARKNIFIHFSPYLRTCESADLLISSLKPLVAERFPKYKVRFQLLGDFALSEWIHDKMKDKPPYIDSNDAYQMYTPNIKKLVNKNCVSNFRPTITLGPFNGPDLSYSQYQERSKDYFKKLLATYDKPVTKKNRDVIIVVGHGYMINNFLSFFTSQPLFEELPEAAINYARRDETEEGEPWQLIKDCVGALERHPSVDSHLNWESDIVYYKTTFVKKEDIDDHGNIINPAPRPKGKGNMLSPWSEDRPRPSFKMPISQSSVALRADNPLCPAAKGWTPQQANKFRIKREFTLKLMNDEAFKKNFDITNHPSKPVTPEVSPSSDPSRQNSVIDLTKLSSNDEIYHPLKLKYSQTGEIPISKLNSRLSNSQMNLSQFLREDSYSSLIGTPRNRSNSAASESVFRLHRENSIDSELDSIPEGKISRNPSRKARQPFRRPLQSDSESLPSLDSTDQKLLSFNKPVLTSPGTPHNPAHIKLISSTNPSKDVNMDSSSDDKRPPHHKPHLGNRMFYQLDDSSSGSEDEEGSNFVWFGENLNKNSIS